MPRPADVTVTSIGAGGDWRQLKAGMKALTKAAKLKKEKLKAHIQKDTW